jgi:hypothetical protein
MATFVAFEPAPDMRDEEVAKLSKVWHAVLKGYLEKQARKKAEEEAAHRRAQEDFNYHPSLQTSHQKRKAAAAAQAEAAAAELAGGSKGGGGGGGGGGSGGGGGAGERAAVEYTIASHLAKKRISKKINYDTVEMLGGEDNEDALPELEAMLSQQQKS